MAISAQIYVPDRGSVTINTAEVNGSVKTLSYSPPRRAERTVNALGGSKTEVQTRAKAGPYEVSMEIYDDASLDDSATALQTILWEAYETGTPLTDMVVVPAGSSIGMLEYAYGGIIHVVQASPHGDLDADTEDEATVSVTIICDTIVATAIIA